MQVDRRQFLVGGFGATVLASLHRPIWSPFTSTGISCRDVAVAGRRRRGGWLASSTGRRWSSAARTRRCRSARRGPGSSRCTGPTSVRPRCSSSRTITTTSRTTTRPTRSSHSRRRLSCCSWRVPPSGSIIRSSCRTGIARQGSRATGHPPQATGASRPPRGRLTARTARLHPCGLPG